MAPASSPPRRKLATLLATCLTRPEYVAVYCFRHRLSLSGAASSAAVAAFSWIMERK
jgi:hypothetical protein